MPHRQLFLDLRQVTRIEQLYRRIHQPQRHPARPFFPLYQQTLMPFKLDGYCAVKKVL